MHDDRKWYLQPAIPFLGDRSGSRLFSSHRKVSTNLTKLCLESMIHDHVIDMGETSKRSCQGENERNTFGPVLSCYTMAFVGGGERG